MKPESIVSILAMSVLVGAFIVIPFIERAVSKWQDYHIALLKKARIKWIKSIARCLGTIEKNLDKVTMEHKQ